MEEENKIEQTPEQTPKRSGSVKKMFFVGIAVFLISAVVLMWVVEVFAIRNASTNKLVVKLAQVFNVPAVDVNGSKIFYSEYARDLKTLNKFYSSSLPEDAMPNDDEISDQVMSRLISNVMIRDLAKKYNLSVNDAEIEQVKQEIIQNFSGEEAMLKDLNEKYGWTFEEYKENVIRPLLLEQKLSDTIMLGKEEENKKFEIEQVKASHILFSVTDPEKDAEVKAEAVKILKSIKAGEDFAKMASKYGSDATKDRGGDLGWFSKGQMVPEFDKAVMALKDGQLNKELVKTQYGYHIIKKTGERVVRDFNVFMTDQIKQANIKFLIPIHNPFENITK